MKNIFILTLSILLFVGCALFNKSENGLSSFDVNLSELPAKTDKELKANFGITEIDRKHNSIKLGKAALNENIKNFTATALLNDDINEFDFYIKQSRPRVRYWEYIVNQLPVYVDYGQQYDAYSALVDKKGQQLAFLTYRMSREGKNISKLFNASKETLYQLIDKEKFHEYRFDEYVLTLIDAYTHLKGLEDYDAQMKRIYAGVMLEDKDEDIFGRTSNQYPIYEPVINEEIQTNYFGSNGMVINQYGEYTDVLWFHSFWVRRYHEGNSEVVLKILNELKTHYAI